VFRRYDIDLRKKDESSHKSANDSLKQMLKDSKEILEKYNIDTTKDVDIIELKALSDYFAFVHRLLNKYNKAKANQIFSEVIGVEPDLINGIKGKGGGINNIAFFSAYYLLTKDEDEEISTLEALEEALVKGSKDIKNRIKELNEIVKKQVEKIGIIEIINALKENDIISSDDAKKFKKKFKNKPNASIKDIIKPLINEFENILTEFIDLNGKMFIPKINNGDELCNICGRVCNGISLRRSFSIIEKMASHSEYNRMENIDNKTRKVCAMCFFENVLRKIQYPYKERSFYLFAIPEYIFTPYHAKLFEKEVVEAFPDKLEIKGQEEEEVEEKEVDLSTTEGAYSSLLKAVQHTIKQKPKLIADELITPVLVVPFESNASLDNWIDIFSKNLQLWNGIGLKYVVSNNFYPEAFSISDVMGSIELKNPHPELQRRLRKWTSAIRKDKKSKIKETTLTLNECTIIHNLMNNLDTLAYYAADKKDNVKKRLLKEFISSSNPFPASKLYVKFKKS
ncbi:MAG: hypothetical protein ACE5KE_09235, partial [Methanosarcinales archaeon]